MDDFFGIDRSVNAGDCAHTEGPPDAGWAFALELLAQDLGAPLSEHRIVQSSLGQLHRHQAVENVVTLLDRGTATLEQRA